MMDSRFDTVFVPPRLTDASDGNATGTLVAQAMKTPLRVLVRNISALGAEVILTFDAATTQTVPAVANTYLLPAGQADSFVVAPGQKLYAITASVPGGRVSIAISEALPLEQTPT